MESFRSVKKSISRRFSRKSVEETANPVLIAPSTPNISEDSAGPKNETSQTCLDDAQYESDRKSSAELAVASDSSDHWQFGGLFSFLFCTFSEIPEQYMPTSEPQDWMSVVPIGGISNDPAEDSQSGDWIKQFDRISLNFTTLSEYGPLLKKEMHRMSRLYMGLGDAGDSIKFELKQSTKAGIKVYLGTIPGSMWQVIRSTSRIKTDKQKIMDLLTTDSRTGEYDETFESVKFIDKIDDSTSIRLFRYAGVWPVSPREFLICSTVADLEDGSSMLSSISVSDAIFPVETGSGFVRAYILSSGVLARNVGDGFCDLTMYTHVDLNGSFPMSIITMFAIANTAKQHKRYAEICGRH